MNMIKNRIVDIAIFVLPILFYLVFWMIDGTIICVDSHTYIDMSLSREPLYPTFLAIVRFLVGPSAYLDVVTLLQSILMGISTYVLIAYLRKEFGLGILFTSLLLMVCFAVSLLCRFSAGRRSMYSNCIMTESICIPIFFLFVRFMLEYLIFGGVEVL